MEVTIPTLDLYELINQLKPLKQLNTRGFHFVVYTMEAADGKFKLLVSDKSSLSASSEVFAKVITPGRVSINGTDFYESIAKIAPETKNRHYGSKEVCLKNSDTKLEVTTTTSYQDKDLSVDQTREFHLVASHLSINEADKPVQIQLKVKAEYFIEMLHLANRLVSSYTADITSLAGILLRARNKVLVAVVSDGTRILEVKYPDPIGVDDFELILPKTTATILHGMVDLGNEIEICADSRRIKFYVDNDGLKTYLASSLLKGVFPEYEPIFKSELRGFEVDTKVLLDNISNVRSSTHDDTYRIRLKFDGKDKIEVTNQKAAGHVGFSNKGIAVRGRGEGKIDALMNALLMEGLLSLIPSEKISLIAPPLDKPIIIEGEFNNIKIRAAIALATE